MLTEKHWTKLALIQNCEIRSNVPLARFTSLGVGGRAESLVIPENKQALREILDFSHKQDIPTVFLGRGFNTLVLDGGIEGIVIALWRMRSITIREDRIIDVSAGASHSAVTHFCLTYGLSGLEFTCGIPGTAGGWIAMNAGIPGQEIGNILLSVDLVKPDGEFSVPAEDMGFHYRGTSGLQSSSAIIGGSFLLEKKPPREVKARVRNYLEKRSSSQPTNQPSCGSVFKNPPGDSAGRLIDEAGLKGTQKGNASISTKHANFIVTNKNASAEDVVALIDLARDRVLEATGVLLATEVKIIGSPRGADGGLR